MGDITGQGPFYIHPMHRALCCISLLVITCPAQSILDTVAGRAYFNLDQIITKADCIYIVAKAVPFKTFKTVAFNELPPFHAVRYHCRVLQTLKQPSQTATPASIEVQDASEEIAKTVHQTYHAKKGLIQPFVGFYRASIPLDSADTLIVFLQRGANAPPFTYALCVKQAWEPVAKKSRVEEALVRLCKPKPESKNPFMRFLTN
jgi:hypothetical protein